MGRSFSFPYSHPESVFSPVSEAHCTFSATHSMREIDSEKESL